MLLLTLAWWFLAQPMPTSAADDVHPVAFGPYPSQELCRVAGFTMMPFDPRFWLPADKATQTKIDKARATMLAAVPHTPGAHQLRDGSMVRFDKAGRELPDYAPFEWTIRAGSSYMALSPCTKVRE